MHDLRLPAAEAAADDPAEPNRAPTTKASGRFPSIHLPRAAARAFRRSARIDSENGAPRVQISVVEVELVALDALAPALALVDGEAG